MNYPLGVFQYYDKDSDKTHLQWSCVDDPSFTHFEIEVYDDNLRMWVKADGRNGGIEKQPRIGSNY
ncbi:hypothetical protein JFL43_16060 [Viridibacillus sp. YIM B01967]|uniref:Uncharacterized protein n=1 Tax=Viridibacillus soli TaxID=2798301 RepID=A0ABS1HAB5_9BACL|nr:hypothetical protein [Viridibacillus soli]MBK3496346.1 hypothetical protein [Viridibacillus soli]